MFVPRHFKESSVKEIKSFIERYSFGTIVTADNGKPAATHLPLELHQWGNDYYITSHFARANPQWEAIAAGNDETLVIYQGPDAYVSSSWYQKEEVPTWNYQAVHVYGKAQIMEQEELEEDLALLMEKYEKHRENPVLWEKLSDQTKKQIRGIVGVKVKVEEVQAAYKLSQNRTEEDYENIIKQLYKEPESASHQVAEAMNWKKKNRPD